MLNKLAELLASFGDGFDMQFKFSVLIGQMKYGQSRQLNKMKTMPQHEDFFFNLIKQLKLCEFMGTVVVLEKLLERTTFSKLSRQTTLLEHRVTY